MATTPEAQFSRSMNLQIAAALPDLTVEKMSNRWRAGIPDFYMEGPSGFVAWREDKFIKKIWTKPREPEEICNTKSWIGQREWLDRAHNNGLFACVIVGAPALALLLLHPFNFDPTTMHFERRAQIAEKLRQAIK